MLFLSHPVYDLLLNASKELDRTDAFRGPRSSPGPAGELELFSSVACSRITLHLFLNVFSVYTTGLHEHCRLQIIFPFLFPVMINGLTLICHSSLPELSYHSS